MAQAGCSQVTVGQALAGAVKNLKVHPQLNVFLSLLLPPGVSLPIYPGLLGPRITRLRDPRLSLRFQGGELVLLHGDLGSVF